MVPRCTGGGRVGGGGGGYMLLYIYTCVRLCIVLEGGVCGVP